MGSFERYLFKFIKYVIHITDAQSYHPQCAKLIQEWETTLNTDKEAYKANPIRLNILQKSVTFNSLKKVKLTTKKNQLL